MVMLVAAAGNTAMQSILPAISGQMGLADVWVSLAFSWSAILWVYTAPKWARASDRRGRKALMKLGTFGFVASMTLCGAVLWLGLSGILSTGVAFILFALFRSLYGGFGSAAPPAVQAYVAARTEKGERTKALSLLASSFGLGTVIGPAIAPYLLFDPVGLAGPMLIFGSFGALVLLALQFYLPNDEPRFAARGAVSTYPSSGTVAQPDTDEDGDGQIDQAPDDDIKLSWRDPRIASWLYAGLVGGHAQAILLGVVGFLIRDRLGFHDSPKDAVEAIGAIMLIGAMATLLAQWGLIPMLNMEPKASISWGSILAMIGVVITGVGYSFNTIAIGFAIASLGFGLFRPAFTAGASLAVTRADQGDVAGKIASINGAAYIIAPVLGVWLFSLWQAATFLLMGAMLLAMIWQLRSKP